MSGYSTACDVARWMLAAENYQFARNRPVSTDDFRITPWASRTVAWRVAVSTLPLA